MGNSILRQQREFPDGAGALHLPQSGCVSRARPAGQKARPAGQRLRRLSHLRCSSLKRWNRRRDGTNLYNNGTTQSGEFRTSYDQVTHLDGGRCNAPAPTLSCGWLHQHNSGTTKSGEFRTSYDQVRKPGPSGRTKKPAWQGKNFPRRLSLLWSSSLKRWNRRRDETSLCNSGTTRSGEFRTSYDQVTHLDGGRCNAPAPTSSCGWLE